MFATVEAVDPEAVAEGDVAVKGVGESVVVLEEGEEGSDMFRGQAGVEVVSDVLDGLDGEQLHSTLGDALVPVDAVARGRGVVEQLVRLGETEDVLEGGDGQTPVGGVEQGAILQQDLAETVHAHLGQGVVLVLHTGHYDLEHRGQHLLNGLEVLSDQGR